MIPVSQDCADVLASSVRPALVLDVESWLGSALLGRVPVVAGSWAVTGEDSRLVPGSVTLDVPRRPEWVPDGPGHPLAAYGQQLRLKIGVRLPTGGVEWVPAGRYRVTSAMPVDEVVQVEAVSLEQLLLWDRLLAPVQLSGSRTAALRVLVDWVLPVLVDTADVSLGAPVTVERDRLQGVADLVDGWPARMVVDTQGTLLVLPPYQDAGAVPVWSTAGRLISSAGTGSDDSGYNGYSVSTVPQDGVTAAVSESWVLTTGPMAWGGPYGRRPAFYASPALPGTRSVLQTVAQTMTLRAARRVRTQQVTCTPDPRVERGDVVRVVDHARGVDMVGRVTATNLTASALELVVSELVI